MESFDSVNFISGQLRKFSWLKDKENIFIYHLKKNQKHKKQKK